jgi:hypothetical protein
MLDEVTPFTTTSLLCHSEPEQRVSEESRVQTRPFANAQGDNQVKPALMTVLISSVTVCRVKTRFLKLRRYPAGRFQLDNAQKSEYWLKSARLDPPVWCHPYSRTIVVITSPIPGWLFLNKLSGVYPNGELNAKADLHSRKKHETDRLAP